MPPPTPVWIVRDTSTELAAEFCRLLAQRVVAAPRPFTLALTGGHSAADFYRALAQRILHHDAVLTATALAYFWSDERLVPLDHPDSNYQLARQALLDPAAVPDALRHPAPTHLPPEDCAVAYRQDLRNHLGPDAAFLPRFPLVILGLGADGHTASLFPRTRLYADDAALVRTAAATRDHPHARLTFTPALINAAAEVWFLITGAAKAEAVARLHARSGPPTATPALVVDPAQTRITYFCDAPAAALAFPK